MYSFLNSSFPRNFLKVLSINVPIKCKQTFHEKVFSLGGTLDEFTSEHTQKTCHKRNLQKSQKSVNDYLPINNTEKNDSNDNIKDYTIKEINLLFQEYIHSGDISCLLNLTKQCIDYQKCPSTSNLMHILTICAQNGDKDTIILIKDLCEKFDPDVLNDNSYFKHYLAEALWVKGNISESLKLFKEVYIENAFLRRRIRLVFKYLVQDVVCTRSEGALISIIKFAEYLLHDYKDFFPLACVWQACFLSEWFTDQCLALELLETNEGLCKSVVSRISYVVNLSLNNHRTEAVYRLLELLLKYKMRMQYSGVLSALLDYQLSRGDLRSSTEIIQWSLNNNVQLPTYQSKSFLDLLINNNKDSFHLKEKLAKIKTPKVKRDLIF